MFVTGAVAAAVAAGAADGAVAGPERTERHLVVVVVAAAAAAASEAAATAAAAGEARVAAAGATIAGLQRLHSPLPQLATQAPLSQSRPSASSSAIDHRLPCWEGEPSLRSCVLEIVAAAGLLVTQGRHDWDQRTEMSGLLQWLTPAM